MYGKMWNLNLPGTEFLQWDMLCVRCILHGKRVCVAHGMEAKNAQQWHRNLRSDFVYIVGPVVIILQAPSCPLVTSVTGR